MKNLVVSRSDVDGVPPVRPLPRVIIRSLQADANTDYKDRPDEKWDTAFALSYVMTMAVPNATEAKYLSSTIMPVPQRAPRFVVHIYHNYCLYTFTLTCFARRHLVTYAVISTKPRANNIKIWFSHRECHSLIFQINKKSLRHTVNECFSKKESTARDDQNRDMIMKGGGGSWDRSRPLSAEGDRTDCWRCAAQAKWTAFSANGSAGATYSTPTKLLRTAKKHTKCRCCKETSAYFNGK